MDLSAQYIDHAAIEPEKICMQTCLFFNFFYQMTKIMLYALQYAFRNQIGQTNKNMTTKEKEVGVQNNGDQHQFPPKDIHNIGKRLACVASISVWFRSKEQGTKVKGRAKNGAVKTENPVPWFFLL